MFRNNRNQCSADSGIRVQLKRNLHFVQGIAVSDKDEGIIKTIIQMAKYFKVKVIAEGVENKVQRDYLKEPDCDEIQGYYYYRPLPAEEVEKM